MTTQGLAVHGAIFFIFQSTRAGGGGGGAIVSWLILLLLLLQILMRVINPICVKVHGSRVVLFTVAIMCYVEVEALVEAL
jgi:hypothetical protein